MKGIQKTAYGLLYDLVYKISAGVYGEGDNFDSELLIYEIEELIDEIAAEI